VRRGGCPDHATRKCRSEATELNVSAHAAPDSPIPAHPANAISDVTADCTGFTIHLVAGEINQDGLSITYTITLNPAAGGPVTETIAVPDQGGGTFMTTITHKWTDFGVTIGGIHTLSGSATLNGGNNNTVDIVFQNNTTTITLSCGVSCSGSIGDFVWQDLNQNGIQDAGEPGIPGVTVNLFKGVLIATMVTDANGLYLFSGLCAGDYTVVVDQTTVPSGLVITTPCSNQAGVGDNSNCSPSPVNLPTDNSSDLTIDFGYVSPPPATKKAVIGPSSVEGAIKISNDDWVNGGYSLKSNVTGDLTVMAKVTVTGPCSNGGTDTVAAAPRTGFPPAMRTAC
jgi:SdrD B-like protein